MTDYIEPNTIVHGDCRIALGWIRPNSVACSIWSPPYNLGKQYEAGMSYEDWISLLTEVIRLHFPILKPGGFLAINIADILCFKDPQIPRIMAENRNRKRNDITNELVTQTMSANPGLNRYQIAELLGCSEQTIDRRLNGNNIRGGKYETQTRVKLVGEILEQAALDAGLYLYDRRIWVKDAAWENSRWHSTSYRAVDEFEYIYFFWKPGTTVIDRNRLERKEWAQWGSRAVWHIPSVRANDDHEAKFPLELPRRIIRLLTERDDVVLDPFVGSGTTALAATQEERKYIGVDILKKYVEMARKACAEESLKVRQQELVSF